MTCDIGNVHDVVTGSDAENSPLVDAAAEAIRRHQEMTAMAAEDHACHLLRAEEKERKEELRRQEELRLMMAEDEASHSLRVAQKRALAEARQSRAHRKIAGRNARVNASILREANRLKAARERQREQVNAKMNLPPVNRRRRQAGAGTRIGSKGSRRSQQSLSNIESISATRGITNTELTQSLLEKRKIRLEAQRKIDQERQNRQTKETERSQRAEKQRQLSAEMEKKRLERERKSRVERNLDKLMEKLGLGTVTGATQSVMNQGNRGQGQRFNFKTTEQWTKQLQQK